MSLDITIKERKEFRCPDCGRLVTTQDVGAECSGGRVWYNFLESVWYYIKNECGYNPDNCKWSTMKEQQNNKRNNHRLTWNGETKTVTEWAEIVGIKKTTIKERLNAGWPVGKALTEPVRQRTRGYRPSAKMNLEG